MLRILERKFKHLLSLLLRFVVGSSPISLPPDARFNRVLIVRQHNQLGDMLCVVPLLRGVRAKYPNAYVTLMASPVNYDVMLNSRYVNKVILYDKREFLGRGFAGWRKLAQFIRELRAENIELVIVPSTVSVSFTSNLLAYVSGAQVRIGVASINGRENPSSFFFNVHVDLDWRATPLRHQSQRNLDIGMPLQLASENLSLDIRLDSPELAIANQLRLSMLGQSKRIIVYHVGAGKVPNRWEADRFGRVANTLASEFDVETFVTSGSMDDKPVQEMIRGLSAPYTLVKGKPIREVAAILSMVNLVITNDTGIMHVAAAVGAPVLSLFGPTEPEQWAPIGSPHRWLRGKDGDVNNISVEEVLIVARTMLSECATSPKRRD